MVQYKAMTHIGSREVNEDSVGCFNSQGGYCFVVADGLGGHGSGEVASMKAVEVFEKEFLQAPKDNGSFLSSAFTNAQTEIMKLQKEKRDRLGLKTTAVCLSIMDGRCMWGHVGDSRLYLFKKNKVAARTLDHSVPQMLVLAGEIKEKHISNHPDRNRLLRAMGVEWDSPRYELSDEVPVSDCQAFLLCTDGFWELIEPKQMCRFLKKSKNAENWLELMASEVEKNGRGKDMDNYTAVSVVFKETP